MHRCPPGLFNSLLHRSSLAASCPRLAGSTVTGTRRRTHNQSRQIKMPSLSCLRFKKASERRYTTERWTYTSHCGSGLINGKTQVHLISATEIEGIFWRVFWAQHHLREQHSNLTLSVSDRTTLSLISDIHHLYAPNVLGLPLSHPDSMMLPRRIPHDSVRIPNKSLNSSFCRADGDLA
jgi:hypothetical protein